MGDFRKLPDDPKAPLLLRGHLSVWGPHPYSPAGAAGPGNFTCLLPAGKSPGIDAYKVVPGAYTPKDSGPGDGWWSEWWGRVERDWKATRAQLDEWQRRIGYVYVAFQLAFTAQYVKEAMAEETAIDVKGLPMAVLAGLNSIAETLLKFTLGGAALGGIAAIEIGGVEGVVPGAALGFEAGLIYLEVTGLADIATYVLMSLGEVSSRLQQGIERAWNAGLYNRPFFDDIKAAAHIMAGAVGILFRVLLEAIIIYFLAKGLGKTVEMLGDSQLGKGFAEWFEKNQNELKSNPKLKPKYKTKGGASEEAAGAAEGGAKGSTAKGATKVEPGKPKTVRTMTADEANASHVAAGNRPPYAKGTTAKDIVTTEDSKFVRVHGETNQARSWMMREEDIKGLSPEQIQNKFALPETPKYVSDVNVPAGTKVRVGTVGAQEGWGTGGATQYELQQRLPQSAFTNRRPLK
jgi:hypothetical protein